MRKNPAPKIAPGWDTPNMNPEVRRRFEKGQRESLERMLEDGHDKNEDKDLFRYLSPENQETFLNQNNASTIRALISKARATKAKLHREKTRKAIRSLSSFRANTRRGYLLPVAKSSKTALSQRRIHRDWYVRRGLKP
jgi:Mg/Co/Ni transporter MgtE